ncbi:5-bromo-4-chloroindolyl phosphate hydrolysis protein [Gracilibacillus ureilyticus]|uniref:5-bromo-4-chloroindolyl phosphate hydrolysis protein n=1 Tax=Gracilibacillus ureilyticus TaxID=531814 RepID=A0A1H9UV56_9BACI|nr:5-bromo-4-chloroindolyl phosphate hydrolysis family protein [Gracilibacillus ureilyticus]SES13296.1 5-bromo-4-chloroindolyl phosphate hydrolysis protein [Gracilibacillus ureilyticus]
MYKFITVIIRILIAVPAMVITWLVSFFGLELSFWYASLTALAGAVLTFWIVSVYLHFRFLKKNQLNMKEYRYIRKNLAEAHQKIRRMQKSLLSIRHMIFLKEIIELLRMIRKIYQITKKEPRRFYLGEKFYFSHLDSAVELTEKYALLSSQPKNIEVGQVLRETQYTIKGMKETIENDLYHILSNDIEQLHFELDFVNRTTKQNK